MTKFENDEILQNTDDDKKALMLIVNIKLAFELEYGFAPHASKIKLLESYLSTDDIYAEFIVFSPLGSYIYKLNNGTIERGDKL